MVDGRPATVYDYFVTHTTDPAARSAIRKDDLSINVGTDENPDWYPAGWLQITHPQPVRGVLLGNQTKNMIDAGQKKPLANAQAIASDGLTMFGFNDPLARIKIAQYGFDVSQKLIRVPARVLNSPRLSYSNDPNFRVTNATWNLSGNVEFIRRANLKKIAIINLTHTRNIGDEFGAIMRRTLAGHGIADNAISTPLAGQYAHDFHTWQPTPEYEQSLLRRMTTMNKADIDNVFVILPGKGTDLYSSVKRVADLHMGVKTVCIVQNKIKKMDSRNTVPADLQYCSNVALKCNLKGAGENHHVTNNAFRPLSKADETSIYCDTMVLGADVAHPLKAASKGCPSIACVVGSIDKNFVTFPGSMRLQYGRQEFIENLWDMAKERLIDWALKHDRRLPERILFYRDGVSESQYDKVRAQEIPQLERAYSLAEAYLSNQADYYRANAVDEQDESPIAGNSKPPAPLYLDSTAALAKLRKSREKFKLTYVVVGKRHNTRFYPTVNQQSFRHKGEINGNVQPGLCVDQVITHPYSFDFYLQSHLPLAGTGRAAHYFVLTNQMNLTSDELQEVTHAFCYVYAKATRAVSYCAPAYYADHLCDRGRAYLHHWLKDCDGYRLSRLQNHDHKEHKGRVLRYIYNSNYWRPYRKMKKYELPRRNPWHPKMDDIMFYL